MNPPPCLPRTGKLCASLLCLALLPVQIPAYPPAPGALFYGSVRDSFGEQFSLPNSWVVFRNGSTVIAKAEIRSGTRPGENYRVMLPLDMGHGDAYVGEAIVPGVTLTIEARIGGLTYPAFGIRPKSSLTPNAAVPTRLDFTIGEDSDDDGIPDLWEYWQLDLLGIAGDDPRYTLETIGVGDYDGDGLSDYLEYIAGTFSFLFTDTLDISFESVGADGWLSFKLVEADGLQYQMERSTDLSEWSAIPVTLDGDRATFHETWTATTTQIRLIEFQRTGTGDAFYRVRRL